MKLKGNLIRGTIMMTKIRLSPLALGLAMGILWGVAVLIMGLLATYYSYGTPFVTSVGVLYVGYEPTIAGAIIGGLIGFVDAFIGGVILAWLYNLFAGCCCKKHGACKHDEVVVENVVKSEKVE